MLSLLIIHACLFAFLFLRYTDLVSENEGFYISHQLRNNKRTAILAAEIEQPSQPPATATNTATGKKSKEKIQSKKDIMFHVYRPNTGLQVRHESLAEIEKKYKKVTSEEAEPHWTQQYDASVNTCSHAYWNANCRNVNMGSECEVNPSCNFLIFSKIYFSVIFERAY